MHVNKPIIGNRINAENNLCLFYYYTKWHPAQIQRQQLWNDTSTTSSHRSIVRITTLLIDFLLFAVCCLVVGFGGFGIDNGWRFRRRSESLLQPVKNRCTIRTTICYFVANRNIKSRIARTEGKYENQYQYQYNKLKKKLIHNWNKNKINYGK